MSRGSQVYYYDVDGLGSVSVVSNASGAVQNTYLYDAWGQTRSQTGSLANPFTYTAREQGEAGTLFYRARYYAPMIGRFLSEDPLRDPESSSYLYSLASAAMYRDPLGLYTVIGTAGKSAIDAAMATLRRMVADGDTFLDCKCGRFFEALGANLAAFSPGGEPYIYANSSPLRLTQKAAYAVYVNDSKWIWIDSRLVGNPKYRRCLTAKLAHEFAHYTKQATSETPEGNAAETACFGGIVQGHDACGF